MMVRALEKLAMLLDWCHISDKADKICIGAEHI